MNMKIRKFAAKAFMACVLSASMLTACYDDGDVVKRIETLEQSVEALKAMKSDIEALQTLVSGKTTVESVSESDGVYTITLSDGKAFTVVGGQTGVVTLAQIDGAYYWATVGADGVKTPIADANGNNLPVYQTPNIRVNETTGEWEVLSNGTWVSTGVSAEQAAVITEVTDDENYAYFTLADGTVVKVAKTSELECTIESGKLYMEAGAAVTVPATVKGGKCIITKPEGWKASLSQYGLTITAPAADNADAELKGTVAIMLVGSNGMSKIAEVGVEVGKAPFTITVEGGLVKITHNTLGGVYYEAVPASEFDVDAAFAKVATAELSYDNVADSVNALIPNVVAGEEYVLWAISGEETSAADIQYVKFIAKPLLSVAYVAEKSTIDNLYITVESKGYAAYYLVLKEAAYYDPEYDDETIVYDAEDGFLDEFNTPTFEGMWKDIDSWASIKAGGEYVLIALPKAEGLTVNDLIKVNIKAPTATFGGSGVVTVEAGEATITSVSATVTPGEGVYKAFYKYYTAVALAEYADDEALLANLIETGSSSAKVANFKKENLEPGAEGFIVAVAVTADGKAGELVKVAANVKPITYNSSIKVEGVVTPGITDASIALSFTGDVVKFRVMLMKYSEFGNSWNYGGEDAKVKSAMATMDAFAWGYGFVGSQDYNAADYASAPFEVTGLANATDYILFIGGYDAEGNLSDVVSKYEFMTKNYSVVRKTDARWEASKPTVEITYAAEDSFTPGYYDVDYKVTPGAGCVKYYTCAVSYFEESNFMDKVTGVMEDGEMETAAATFETWGSPYYVIYVVWEDAEGNLYEAYELPFEGHLPAAGGESGSEGGEITPKN